MQRACWGGSLSRTMLTACARLHAAARAPGLDDGGHQAKDVDARALHKQAKWAPQRRALRTPQAQPILRCSPHALPATLLNQQPSGIISACARRGLSRPPLASEYHKCQRFSSVLLSNISKQAQFELGSHLLLLNNRVLRAFWLRQPLRSKQSAPDGWLACTQDSLLLLLPPRGRMCSRWRPKI